jgi:DNA-binding MarR family transcriptional regulator
VPDTDHTVFEGHPYHAACLPRRAFTGLEPAKSKKLPFTVRFYKRLESIAEEGKITYLSKVFGFLAVEFNTNTGYLDYIIKQLQDAGCVERKFDLLTLIKEPQVGAPQEESAP